MPSENQCICNRASRALEVDARVNQLRRDWRRYQDALQPSIRKAGSHLAIRFEIHRDVEVSDWIDHFSPLTMLYSNLQNERCGIGEGVRRDADLAHLCFLISTFCLDRVADGQITLNANESRFVRTVLQHGRGFINALVVDSPAASGWIRRLMGDYERASLETYESRTQRRVYTAIRSVAAARGYPGLLVPLALAAHAGADDSRLRRIKTAFDCLMLGMQWLDDLMDWREDLAIDDINLLLKLLRGHGLNARLHPENALREVNVGFALMQYGVIDAAARHSAYWLRQASRRQRNLGSPILARCIESRTELVRREALSEHARVMSDVTVNLIAIGEIGNCTTLDPSMGHRREASICRTS